jgi:transposase-like protein
VARDDVRDQVAVRDRRIKLMRASMPRSVREFAERDAHAFDLFHKGVAPAAIAERLGINRVATVHQMIERARRRIEAPAEQAADGDVHGGDWQ